MRPSIETSFETLEALLPLTADALLPLTAGILLPLTAEVGALDLTPALLAVTGGVFVVTRVTQVDLAGAD